MKNKYIFMDFNGTIINDVKLCFDLLNEMLAQYEGKTVTMEEYLNIFCFPVYDYYVKAGFTFNGYSFDYLADYFIKEYDRRFYTESFIFEEVKEFVNRAHELGYKIVICSASLKELLINQLKHFGYYEMFDDIIALENHYANGKVSLALEYAAKHEIDLESSLFIGDTDHDALVGNALNIKSVLVAKGHQTKEILGKVTPYVCDDLLGALAYLK